MTYPHADAPSLRDLDLRVAPGQFVILCGANGSGKSTALRLMNGLIPHFHEQGVLTGTITVSGLVMTSVEPDELGLHTVRNCSTRADSSSPTPPPEEVAFAMENFGFASARGSWK